MKKKGAYSTKNREVTQIQEATRNMKHLFLFKSAKI